MLKVAHHGSQYTTDAEFLKMLSPKLAMISCGRDNSYGHPHRELLERLRDAGAKVYRTDEGGAIEINVISNKVSINPYLFRWLVSINVITYRMRDFQNGFWEAGG